MEETKFVKTGIDGLDEIMRGGIVPNSSFLVTGGPGTGKSIMGLQFVIDGALKFNEPGVYITVEESADDIRYYARRLGWNIEELERKGLVTIIEQQVLERSMVKSLVSIEYIKQLVREKSAKRIVLDSLTLFNFMYSNDTTTLRTELIRFIKNMRTIGVTLLMISDRYSTGIDDIAYAEEDFIFHGVVLLSKLRVQASYERCLHIVKQRGVDHSMKIYPFKIGEGGITVITDATPFALTSGRDQRIKE